MPRARAEALLVHRAPAPHPCGGVEGEVAEACGKFGIITDGCFFVEIFERQMPRIGFERGSPNHTITYRRGTEGPFSLCGTSEIVANY